MDLSKAKLRIYPVLLVPFLFLFFASPASASYVSTTASPLHTVRPSSVVSLLDSSFNPNAPVGGVPFCSSSLGTIICLTPSFLKKAYNFPKTNGERGLTGEGQTIVIVDAFGAPLSTLQSDLDKFDTTFGVPSTTVTVLCGPTWTGAERTDVCPLNTPADITTVGNTQAGQACGGPGGVTSWAEETNLDLAMSHSMAPGANIVLVVANDCFDSSIYTAEMAVVSQSQYGGSVMSQSFGEPDDEVTCTNAVVDPVLGVLYCTARDPTLLDLPNSVFQLAQENQWTVIASSGDDGANENTRAFGSGELTPSFPATSPLVLSAGGTQGNPYGGQYGAPPYTSPLGCAPHTNCNVGLVTINGGEDGCGTAARPGTPTSCKPVGYGGEAAWNEFSTAVGGGAPGLSTGGGVSYLYSRPSYQSDLPGSFTTMFGQRIEANGRLNPDVSFNSAVFGGFLVWLGFLPAPRWGVFGGTSAASPAWAGIIALLNQAHNGPVGFINPAIYSMGAYYVGAERGPFHDITSGENSDTAGNFFGTYCFAAAPSPPPPQCTTYFDGWQAGPGYDLTTGWGTPNVSVFINAIQSFL